MKKISLVLACSALCAAAFAEADTITTASANTFGAVKIVSKVTGADNYTYVAVPFEEFPDANASSNKRLYNGIIIPGLCSGATMSIYAGGDAWQGYVSNGASWNAALAGSGEGGATSDSPAPGSSYADVGTGVFWNPGTMTEQSSYSVYSYGQVPTGYSKKVSLPADKTLVCPPGANALEVCDLNEVDWTGVAESTFETVTSSKSGEVEVVKKVKSVGDMIQFRDPATGGMKQLYYATVPGGNGEKKWGAVSKAKPFGVAAAKIPAGTAFWYVPKEGNTAASVTWH
jgi:hypothetical protein